jgi:hypothetical protein
MKPILLLVPDANGKEAGGHVFDLNVDLILLTRLFAG